MRKPFYVTVCASGGGGNFQALIDSQHSVGFVINKLLTDRACGAISRAERHGIPYQILDVAGPENSFDVIDAAIPLATDLVVLAGFMPILSPQICKKWVGKIINTHPSLLPKYGGKGMYGVKVQEAVLKNKERFAGCTVHYVSEDIDAGAIILQQKITVEPGESAWELGGRIFLEENKLLPNAVKMIMNSRGKEDV